MAEKADSRFIVGIDLGTTNCVLSFIDTVEDDRKIEIFPIPQIVSPGEVAEKELLPSFIYLPTQPEKEGGGLVMPWDPFGERVIGEYARKRGAEVPGRLVASAKSWLCHRGVDRTAPILPADAPDDETRLSPVVASASYLRHIKAAWNSVMGGRHGEKLEDQDVYITIPASFDAVARDLTVKAAASAGLDHVTLLEEPQAAFYAWLNRNSDTWNRTVEPGDTVLVCDVGGGTSDFSMIRVEGEEGRLALERVAVGDHILLGGDNMDLAISWLKAEELKKQGTKLDRMQMQTLWHNCRLAKEQLLSDSSVDEVPVVITGRGTGLVGGTIRTSLRRDEVNEFILDGFLPLCDLSDSPAAARRSGLQEMGLPYAPDSAITKYLAAFIRDNAPENASPMPSAVLFNGGVFKSSGIKQGLLDVMSLWAESEENTPIELSGADLDLAVSRGAAFFGLARRNNGLRIKSGLERTYYIGVEMARQAIPGMPAPVSALCIAPKGTEEGTEIPLSGQTFGLVVGEAVEFQFLGAVSRAEDRVGEMIEDYEEHGIEPVASIKTSMEAPGIEPGTLIPVQIRAEVTEVGTLALSLVSAERDVTFNLEFDVRN
jgi:hypothetical protein